MSRKKLKIGVSACLLGIKCRYDGKAKGDPRIYELLKDKVDLITIFAEFNSASRDAVGGVSERHAHEGH